LKNINEKIEEKVVETYNKIENGVVSGYKKIEDKFVDKFLKKDSETVEEAKDRIKRENNEIAIENEKIENGGK